MGLAWGEHHERGPASDVGSVTAETGVFPIFSMPQRMAGMKNIFRPAVALIAAATLIPTLTAAAPPPGYPSRQIMGYATDTYGASIPIRLGFYDSDADRGFGKDKAYYKHNIRSVSSIQFVIRSTNAEKQGTQRVYHAWAIKKRCVRGVCWAEKQIKIRGVAETAYKSVYYNQTVGGRLGSMTTYCEGTKWCPDWVDYALSGGGSTTASVDRDSTSGTDDSASIAQKLKSGEGEVEFYELTYSEPGAPVKETCDEVVNRIKKDNRSSFIQD